MDPDTASETRPFASYEDEAAPGDVLVYQFATASAIASWLAGRPETLVVNYHNVTPPEFYAPWDNAMARHQLRAQAELRGLAPRAALGLAVSAFNESELRAGRGSPARRSSRPRRCVDTGAGSARRAGAASAGRRPGPAPAGSAWGVSPRTRASSSR